MRDLFEFTGYLLGAVINLIAFPVVLLAELFLLALFIHKALKRAFPVWLQAMHLVRPVRRPRQPRVGIAIYHH